MNSLRTTSTESLADAARTELLKDGFEPDFPPATVAEAQAAAKAGLTSKAPRDAKDMRQLLWSSIDNEESRDLDQIEYTESLPDGSIRVYVGIADVDALVPKGSAVDQHAAKNTTTLYLGVKIFPMLPEVLSTGATSLVEGEDRIAHVVQLVVSADGTVKPEQAYTALVKNKAKLAYESIGPWLSGGQMPQKVRDTPGLEDQLRMQGRLKDLLHATRQKSGAINIDSIEPQAVVRGDRVVDIIAVQQDAARDVIEELMIAANTAAASLLASRNSPAIRRVVREPRRWDGIVKVAAEYGITLPPSPDGPALADFLAKRRAADPVRFPDLSLTIVKLLGPGEYVLDRAGPEDDEAHFGLGVAKYVHSTAPNRRYADLINQRLLKATDSGAALPYTDDELDQIAQHCNERELEAHQIERLMRKRLAAAALVDRVGQSFDAIVTGKSEKGTYVRVLGPPVEGRLMHGDHAGLEVGSKLRVKLTHVDSRKGFIDFSAA